MGKRQFNFLRGIPMTSPCVLKKQTDWKSAFLTFSSDRLDRLHQGGHMDSIDDISKALFNSRADIMGQAALALIERNFGHLLDQEYCECPDCGHKIKAMPNKVKREITTLIGPIVLYRPYFYCKKCNVGFYPLDEALGLSDRKVQADIQELEAWLASEMPYETAGETLKRCAGIELSNHHVHDVTNTLAKELDILDVCPSQAEIQRQVERLSKGKFRRPILMIGVDGASAPTRPEPSSRKGKRGKGKWLEVKGFRLYLLDNQRIIHLISWHQIKSDKQLASDLSQIKQAGLIPEDRLRICVIGDGASWIWNRTRELFPDAKRVLDYYHCSEYLHALAQAQYGEGSLKGQEWIEATLTRLFCGQANRIIAGIKRMKPSSEAAKDQILKTAGYLTGQIEKIDYRALKRGGYQIGSGGIESSNKFICNVRLKRSGAWWYPTNANNILKLRCAKYNGTFDRIMSQFKDKKSRNETGQVRSKIRLVVDNSSRNR